MRLLFSLAVAGLAIFALIACNPANSRNQVASNASPAIPAKPSAPPATAVPADGVRRITTVELKGLIDKGQVYVLDVRNEASYNLGHIRGAKLIPHTEIAMRSKEVPRDKLIVTYCS